MRDAFDSILPVATLILGAGLANFLKFSELRRSIRLEAADQLAALPVLLWDKTDPEAWLKLNAATSRLSIRLNVAGVHPDLAERLRDSAIVFWRSVHVVGHDEDGDIWVIGESADESWNEKVAVVAEILGTNSRIRSWWLGRRAQKLVEKWDRADKAVIASVSGPGE